MEIWTSKNFSSLKLILLFAILLVFSGCKEQIIHNLEEADANRIVTVLHDSGLDVEKKIQPDGRWSIAVPKDNSMMALRLLEDKRVLRAPSKSNILKGSVISSREAQKFEYERGLSREIENTLLSLDGVLDARVHLNLPTPDPLLGKVSGNLGGTGSVLMVVSQAMILNNSDIAGLVSGASGIPADKISVIQSKSAESDKTAAPLFVNQALISKQFDWALLLGAAAVIVVAIILFISGKRRFQKLQQNFEVSGRAV